MSCNCQPESLYSGLPKISAVKALYLGKNWEIRCARQRKQRGKLDATNIVHPPRRHVRIQSSKVGHELVETCFGLALPVT